MQAFKKIGKERVVWRYDPIFLNDVYTMDYHKKYFKVLASKLAAYTEKCTVSFLDLHKNTLNNVRPFGIMVPTKSEQFELMSEFARTAQEYGFFLDTCAEDIDLSSLGLQHASCIDKLRLERIGHYHLKAKKDPNQRSSCGCISSIDIGAYNTCKNACVYCYANFSRKSVENQTRCHNPNNPLLFGEVGPEDIVKERKMESLVEDQLSIFDF